MDLLDKMATYVRVIEAGSFSAAARQLRISSAAVSRQISTLEADLGIALLLRTTRRMTTTPSGLRYYERCVRILRDVDDAQAVGRGDAVEGLLTVSAPVTFGTERVLPYVQSLLAKHPGLRIDLRLEDRVVDLVGEAVDVAIRGGVAPPESTGFVAHDLVTFRRVLVASPAYLKRRGEPKTVESLGKHDLLEHLAGSGALASWALTRDEREAPVRGNVVFRSNVVSALRALALEGAGIAFVPEWLVMGDVERRALRVLLRAWEGAPITFFALHRTEHRGRLRVRALIDHLRAAYASAGAGPSAPKRAPRP